jgi:Spy/CpxP family protein refolding chaperone
MGTISQSTRRSKMMRTIPKIFFIGCMVAVTVSGLDAMAEEFCDHQGHHGAMMAMDPQKMATMRAEHQKALHDALKLDAKQETAWKKFAASTDQTPLVHPNKAEIEKLNAPQRMEKMLEGLHQHEARMTEHLAALKEFYAVLTPEQQQVLDEHSMPRLHEGMHGSRH